jgi:threonine/homoserine/homoserine lactone efflux protein
MDRDSLPWLSGNSVHSQYGEIVFDLERGRTESSSRSSGPAYRDGLLTNALNPKTALFRSALLPQLIEPGAPWWLPAALVATTGTVSSLRMSVYAVVFFRVGDMLGQPRIRRAVDGIIGTALIGFGVRLAFAQPYQPIQRYKCLGLPVRPYWRLITALPSSTS